MTALLSPEEKYSLAGKLKIPEESVLFTGGCNQDIECKPDGNVIKSDSLPGSIELSCGGVARNLAENAARLGLKCSLYAPVGDDPAGRSLLAVTNQTGVDTRYCPIVTGKRTCSYAAFMDNSGEMIYAVNDMKLMDDFLPSILNMDLIYAHEYRVVDANLPVETLEAIGNTGEIVLADPVSAHKIHRLDACINKTLCLKPNRIEAEGYCGFSLDKEADFFKACEVFIKRGCKRVFLSAGPMGFFCMDDSGEKLKMEGPGIKIKSVTGAGDAASAALVLAHLCGLNLKESAYLATLAASSALLCTGSINPELSLDYLLNISKEFNL